jgi:molecular chaperone GrpE
MTEEKVVEQTINAESTEGPAANNELEAAKAQAAEYLDQWRRTTAEFQNYRKRTERDWLDMRATAGADVITQLLPVLDDFDRAFKAVPEEMQTDSWLEGFRLIERKYRQVLEQAGVTVIEAVGKPFDPNFHESAAMEESDQPHGTILEEYRKGYMLKDKVLRPAMVKIAQ